MKAVSVIAVAARTPAWLAACEKEYSAQIRNFNLHCSLVRPATAAKETAAVLRAVPPNHRFYVLSAEGKSYDSDAFAIWLRTALEESPGLAFVIGGAAGAPPALLEKAAGVLSLSPLTFAHQVARLVLIEQLFRADCIMRGHPYPK